MWPFGSWQEIAKYKCTAEFGGLLRSDGFEPVVLRLEKHSRTKRFRASITRICGLTYEVPLDFLPSELQELVK